MEAIFIILIKLVIGLIFMYGVSRFVDFDVEQTDKSDNRWDLGDIKGDPAATSHYAATLQKSKRLFYTVLLGIIVFVSFL
jgi:hypothetical protein